ncbi:MAG TPA: hypothetical protein VF044_07380 [Actinomycetota bacterium]
MSTFRILIAVVALLALSPVPGRAGSAEDVDLEILRDTIRANRRALVAVNLRLTDEEAERFWPIYGRYQAALTKVHDRLVEVIGEYTAGFADLSNEKALALVDDYLAVEAERVAVRRAYLDEIAEVLPGRTVARFYQIENKMDAVVRYDLAAAIPVMDQ